MPLPTTYKLEGGDHERKIETTRHFTGEEEYRRLTVNELKDILREQELPISGQKDDLIARLLDRNNDNNNDTVLLTEQDDD